MENHFYPSNTDNSLWLSYYSQILDYVEIDSSFYSIPNHFMVKSQYKKTPEHFRFTAKFPKAITDEKRLKNTNKELEYFFNAINPLYDKTMPRFVGKSDDGAGLPPSPPVVTVFTTVDKTP